MRHRAATWLVAGGLALPAAGCGLLGPARRPGPSATANAGGRGSATTAGGGPSPAAIAGARSTHEIPTPVPRQRVLGGWRTPRAAVTAFTEVYVNWSAATVGARLRALAASSLGQARSELLIEAGEADRDRELHAGGVANAGTVEAVAPATGRAGGWVAVTRERTSAAAGDAYRGIPPQWHVSLATVVRLSDGLWVVSGWQPES